MDCITGGGHICNTYLKIQMIAWRPHCDFSVFVFFSEVVDVFCLSFHCHQCFVSYLSDEVGVRSRDNFTAEKNHPAGMLPWKSSRPNKVWSLGWSMWRIPYYQWAKLGLWTSWKILWPKKTQQMLRRSLMKGGSSCWMFISSWLPIMTGQSTPPWRTPEKTGLIKGLLRAWFP